VVVVVEVDPLVVLEAVVAAAAVEA